MVEDTCLLAPVQLKLRASVQANLAHVAGLWQQCVEEGQLPDTLMSNLGMQA